MLFPTLFLKSQKPVFVSLSFLHFFLTYLTLWMSHSIHLILCFYTWLMNCFTPFAAVFTVCLLKKNVCSVGQFFCVSLVCVFQANNHGISNCVCGIIFFVCVRQQIVCMHFEVQQKRCLCEVWMHAVGGTVGSPPQIGALWSELRLWQWK